MLEVIAGGRARGRVLVLVLALCGLGACASRASETRATSGDGGRAGGRATGRGPGVVGPGDRVAAVAGARQLGRASFYAKRFHGRKTANGERFDMHAMTCAHRTLPFGTRLRVRRQDDGRTVTCRVNDRGPYGRGRVIDLSLAGAEAIGMVREGVIPVELTVLEVPPCRGRRC